MNLDELQALYERALAQTDGVWQREFFDEFLARLQVSWPALRDELIALRRAIRHARNAMAGEGVNDQGEAWDVCMRILDAALQSYEQARGDHE